ncbi:type 2 lanthipeptide synthetase LanM family protein [Sorangium sp. So ce726]|uniref:type 2 lanthipeptide synthetase LanM family protein n=1 Tax=Sorangium sp. So ce726 TaxID=3133319 RepID=UPI003F60D949
MQVALARTRWQRSRIRRRGVSVRPRASASARCSADRVRQGISHVSDGRRGSRGVHPTRFSFALCRRISVMTPRLFDVPDWHQATALNERLDLLRANRGAGAAEDLLESERARRWRAQAPFTDTSLFAQKLASEGLAEEEWERLVGEPASMVHERAGGPPAFLAGLVAAYEHPADVSVEDILPGPERLDHRTRGAAGLLVAVEPLLRQTRARLREGLHALVKVAPFVPFDPAVAERLWLLDLASAVLAVMDRTFVLEMHVARVQGLLSGDTPEQRFASFLERLRDPAVVLAIFREYPVLAKDLVVCVDQWVAYGLEFFRHLITDWEAIRAAICPSSDPGELVAIETGAGDPHRQGRSVVLLRFSSGLKLVYKPKALAVDVHFQELVAFLNARGLDPALRELTVLDRGTYGWLEHATPATCASEEEVHRFYRRQGALVLLSYMLEATDFHYENVIAVGEHPVLIDLETLFHPYPNPPRDVPVPTEGSFYRSVLRSGLLPSASTDIGLSGVDISGLGTPPGQKTTVGMPTWEEEGTDGLRFTRKVMGLSAGHNRATLNGAHIDVIDYIDDIVAGFSAAYRLVVALRDALLAPDGPIARFAHDEVRVIVRSSQRYGVMRYESRHPNLLRDALDRDRSLDRLWNDVVSMPSLAKLISSEREDLWRGDIPMFFTTPSETTLRDSMGRPIEGVLDEPSYQQVVRHLRSFDERDLDRQIWLLRASLSTLETRTRGGRRHPRRPPADTAAPIERSRLLRAARGLSERIGTLAQVDNELIYYGVTLRGDRWSFGSVDNNLYSGATGIALFLGYAGAITEDSQATALARATLRQAHQSMERGAASLRGIGAFEGWGSLLYASTHLAVLWDDPALLAEAAAIAARIETLVPEDKHLDLVGGAAGAIAALLGLHSVSPSEAVLRAAVACGAHLIERAQPAGNGIAWPCPEEVLAPLTGFAHGAAGAAWALHALARATGQARFEAAAQQARAYERGTFVPGKGWPDLRKSEGASLSQPSYETAWCHGAPGIGLSRLPIVAANGDETARAEVLAALEVTFQQRYAPDHSLCHGDLGNIELFTEAARVLDEPRYRAEADRRAAVLLDSLDRDGPICGLPLAAEEPGLMVGISGIGYGLLRLAEPTIVPSVLLLAPPPARAS